MAGTDDEGLLYLDHRLRNRATFIEWDKEILGPIHDTIGVEQGGCASDRIYKLVNNEQLKTAQQSKLGVDLGLAVSPRGDLSRVVISAIGQADDIALVSSSLRNLQLLLHLSKMYCNKYQVKLVGPKTKLLVYNSRDTVLRSEVDLASTTITVNGAIISPSPQAPHVGIVRSVIGNEANILARLSAHRKAMYGLLSAGLARSHRASPAATLRLETIFGVPVLLSGLASLVLTAKEENMVSHHYKVHLERLLKLHQATPAPVVFMLAGCLPLQAQLHLKMFAIFGQLCRLNDGGSAGDNILAVMAGNIYSSSTTNSSKSWFWRIRQLTLQYALPHPSEWLLCKPSKSTVKSTTKSAVLQYWLAKIRDKADTLPSLQYLKTEYLGLTRCHAIFWTCGSSPWELEKATTQARLLSGRYRVEALSGHWVPWNRDGMCSLPQCWRSACAHKGTLESLLLSCPSLSSTRDVLLQYQSEFLSNHPDLLTLVTECLVSDPVQFWLDCSTMKEVIRFVQENDRSVLYKLFKLTRNFCHTIHSKRVMLLDQSE